MTIIDEERLKDLAPSRLVSVKRSEFRKNQRKYLSQARDRIVVEILAYGAEGQKYIVDKRYFLELQEKLKSLVETLQIMTDTKLFSQILRASTTVDEDIRLGKLHSFEEAFQGECKVKEERP
jgi:hypothetical protein